MDKKILRQYKSTFHFGASVKYDFILFRGYGKEDFNSKHGHMKCKKKWNQKKVLTRTGIVIGWRWLSNGISNYDSEYGSSYVVTESIFAIEIKCSMMNRTDLVLPKSLTVNEGGKYWYAPLFLGILPDRIPTMSDKDKQWLSNVMKSVPRDSKGRWKRQKIDNKY